MQHELACYRCGASLEHVPLPLSRRDLCPDCGAELHVCKMCVSFDPAVPQQCREDGAEEVKDKETANFCDWFKPSESAFDPARRDAAERARDELDALFGGEEAGDKQPDDALTDAEKLFK